METQHPARPHQASGPRMHTRRDNARAEAVERVARWKRAISAGAVVAFGALIGLIGIAGAHGASGPSADTRSGSPPVTSRGDRSASGAAGDDRRVAPSQAPDDGFFGGQDGGYGFGGNGLGGYGFGGNGSQSGPLGQSGVS